MRVLATAGLAAALLLFPGSAGAARIAESEHLHVDLGGDVKTLLGATFFYDHLLMPDDPGGRAAVDLRFKLDGRWSFVSWSLHHQMAPVIRTAGLPGSGLAAVGADAPPASPFGLAWTAVDEPTFALSGRIDRLLVAFHAEHFDLALGRQPISFGTGLVFAPMDIATVFAPDAVDREYRPGTDALRLDFWIGQTGHVEVVAAVTGGLDLDGLLAAGHGGFTVGVFDIGFLAAKVHGDAVFGFDTAGSLGPIAVHSDLTVTVPSGEAPFVRAVVGAGAFFPFGLSLAGEVYVQSLGASYPSQYMQVARTERFRVGELWTMGHLYGALSADVEVTPLLHLNLAAIANLLDPSLLLGPGLAWSVAENADLGFGAFFAIGRRPEEMQAEDLFDDRGRPLDEDGVLDRFRPRSEFGLMPHQAWLQVRLYF